MCVMYNSYDSSVTANSLSGYDTYSLSGRLLLLDRFKEYLSELPKMSKDMNNSYFNVFVFGIYLDDISAVDQINCYIWADDISDYSILSSKTVTYWAKMGVTAIVYDAGVVHPGKEDYDIINSAGWKYVDYKSDAFKDYYTKLDAKYNTSTVGFTYSLHKQGQN